MVLSYPVVGWDFGVNKTKVYLVLSAFSVEELSLVDRVYFVNHACYWRSQPLLGGGSYCIDGFHEEYWGFHRIVLADGSVDWMVMTLRHELDHVPYGDGESNAFSADVVDARIWR